MWDQNGADKNTTVLILTCVVCGHKRTFRGLSFNQVLENMERDKWVVISDGYSGSGAYCPFCPKPEVR